VLFAEPTQHVEFAGTFYTRPERSMALAEQARRVATEFDFSTDAVNKAVREFIREMGTRQRPAAQRPHTDGAQMRGSGRRAPS